MRNSREMRETRQRGAARRALFPHGQHRATRLPNDVIGRGAEEHVIDGAVTVGAEHDKVCLPLRRHAYDFAMWRTRSDHAVNIVADCRAGDSRVEPPGNVCFKITDKAGEIQRERARHLVDGNHLHDAEHVELRARLRRERCRIVQRYQRAVGKVDSAYDVRKGRGAGGYRVRCPRRHGTVSTGKRAFRNTLSATEPSIRR